MQQTEPVFESLYFFRIENFLCGACGYYTHQTSHFSVPLYSLNLANTLAAFCLVTIPGADRKSSC